MGGNKSEKVKRMGEGKGEFSVAIFKLVSLLDEVSACAGMALFYRHHLHSLRKVCLSAFFVGGMVMRQE